MHYCHATNHLDIFRKLHRTQSRWRDKSLVSCYGDTEYCVFKRQEQLVVPSKNHPSKYLVPLIYTHLRWYYICGGDWRRSFSVLIDWLIHIYSILSVTIAKLRDIMGWRKVKLYTEGTLTFQSISNNSSSKSRHLLSWTGRYEQMRFRFLNETI